MIEGHTWHIWKECLLKWAGRNHQPVPVGFDVDAEYCGAPCETLLKDFQRHSGLQPDGILGPLTAAKLRLLIAPPTPAVTGRQRMLNALWWGVHNAAGIHYPPGDVRIEPQMEVFRAWGHETPISCDCSEAVDAASYAGGLVDQCGGRYIGAVYTGTLLANLTAINQSEILPGDIGIYGFGTGTHAVAVLSISDGRDNPFVFSHGSEIGPLAIPLSWETPYHPGQPLRWRRLDTRLR